jgi:hypothetical protein
MLYFKSFCRRLAAAVCLLAFLPSPVLADDPCEDAKRTVRDMVRSLERGVVPGVIDGRFHVQEISRNYDRVAYRVTYQGGGKVLFEKRIPAFDPASMTHVSLAAPQQGKALVYNEASGAGGRMQCRSTIFRTPSGFGSRFRN